MLASKRLTDAGFKHGFSLRDAPLPWIADTLGIDPSSLYQVRQVHGRTLVVAGGSPEAVATVEADALMAKPKSGHAVLVKVADCVPVLFGDPKTGRVAAVHAGWRGIELRILDVAFAALVEAKDLLVAIGPSIGPCCFEVGTDVAARIVKVSSDSVIDRTVGDKAYVNLRRAVRTQLLAFGIANDAIEDVPGCTKCEPKRFHSYRRDGKDSGRLLGVIASR